MRDCTHGTPTMRDQLETDARTSITVTVGEAALLMDGAQVPPGPPRTPITITTRPSLETNALIHQLILTSPTETTTVTEIELAQELDGAKVNPDDRHPIRR